MCDYYIIHVVFLMLLRNEMHPWVGSWDVSPFKLEGFAGATACTCGRSTRHSPLPRQCAHTEASPKDMLVTFSDCHLIPRAIS